MFALMEGTLVLAAVAQQFRLILMPGAQIVPMASITLRPRNGVPVRLQKRRSGKLNE
jgi:cytochrome P450